LGLAHRVARFRSLTCALVLMLLACIAVEAGMAYVRTEAAVHLAVDSTLQSIDRAGARQHRLAGAVDGRQETPGPAEAEGASGAAGGH
jgi:hypothetical protein